MPLTPDEHNNTLPVEFESVVAKYRQDHGRLVSEAIALLEPCLNEYVSSRIPKSLREAQLLSSTLGNILREFGLVINGGAQSDPIPCMLTISTFSSRGVELPRYRLRVLDRHHTQGDHHEKYASMHDRTSTRNIEELLPIRLMEAPRVRSGFIEWSRTRPRGADGAAR